VSSAPIDVCLSVDVEFSINNALTNPERPPLGADWVYGESGGHSQGLGFLLDCLDRHGLKGTFFTEVFNSYHFGDAPMAGIVRDILAHGQDVQLHLHPVWLYFKYPKWRDELRWRPRPRDIFTDRESDEIANWLQDGVDILERLSGSRPIAFRSGNLNAGRVLYQGMRKAGIRLASNIGVGLSAPVEDELMLYSGLHSIEGVTEVPVTTYRMPLPGSDRLLLLTATGSAVAEMRAVLDAAHRLDAGPVVLLLHPHDFRIAVQSTPGSPPDYRPDPVRQSRLERLCAYLGRYPERFRVTTFAESAERWQTAQSNRNPLLTGSLPGLASRMIENKLLPIIRRLPQ
jgi:peptidoglycan/xylan/chitin deacetylase (PgdA/CDA1 family)